MDEAKPSRTSDIPAIMRAVHQTSDDEPKILIDPIAPKLLDISAVDANWLAPILGHPFARHRNARLAYEKNPPAFTPTGFHVRSRVRGR
jgi:hypothetical protein